MTSKTDRQLAIMSFIRKSVEADGQAPTLAEIAAGCGFASKSAVRKHVLALQTSGQLEAPSRKARSARPKSVRAKTTPLAHALFEIGPSDIQALTDSDLRELVSRLCRSRLTAKGYPPEYVTWGGDQRAPDGGIDVRVEMPQTVANETGFSAHNIGIQVKASRMGPYEIRHEMCPGGVLRSSIRDIMRVSGAYYIACSDDVTDVSYQARVKAMRNAAREDGDTSSAIFDFYDATRLADWANEYPGIVAWVRTRLGIALYGWRPWGQWARTREERRQSFFDDTVPRLIDASDPDKTYTLVDGLRHIRSLLRERGMSVRIVGVSGVGKTRFAQALFEEEAVSDALSPDLAIYADSSESPAPTPQALVDQLQASNRRAILVIDDCSSQLHSHLTSRCKNAKCLSLLTIEYDIREDNPEETKVFRLERGSSDLVAKVIYQQFPHISQVNVSTISAFADGNSRVAIALAETLDHKESLAGLSNDTLFERLFWQRREVDPILRRAAEVCALVYSFDGEDEEVELPILASLADISMVALHRQIDTLIERGLAQTRGQWRAILPHAIANALAGRALSPQLHSLIESRLVGYPRLLKSFSRRLGYLHDSPGAVAIVKRWYAEDGLLGQATALTYPLIDILVNVAPIDPDSTLQLIERIANERGIGEVLSTPIGGRPPVARLLRRIAYDARYFDRCLSLLIQMALSEPGDSHGDKTSTVITSMFAIRLSGTHASAQQRASWIRRSFQSSDVHLQNIAIGCLDAALEDRHFTSYEAFDFGARSRDYGYSPKGDEAVAWFQLFTALTIEFALQTTATGARVRALLATRFRCLWGSVKLYDELEQAAKRLIERGWEQGWLAIKQTIRFDGKNMTSEGLARLMELETLMRPKTLVERTKAVVLHYFAGGVDITDGDADDANAHERADHRPENWVRR